MKKKKILVLLLVVLCVTLTTACDKKETKVEESHEGYGSDEIIKRPLKEDYNESEYQIKVAVQKSLEESYKDDVIDARIYVKRIYSSEEEKNIEALKDMNLTNDEVAFEVEYELKPAEGADINLLTVPNGEYDSETGWITNKFGVGIIKATDSGYELSNFGTGW